MFFSETLLGMSLKQNVTNTFLSLDFNHQSLLFDVHCWQVTSKTSLFYHEKY